MRENGFETSHNELRIKQKVDFSQEGFRDEATQEAFETSPQGQDE